MLAIKFKYTNNLSNRVTSRTMEWAYLLNYVSWKAVVKS